MRTWDFGINSHPDWRLGHITLYFRPWWLSLLEWFAFAVAWNWLWKIKLPKWPVRCWDRDLDDTPCSPRDWWGTVGGLVHAYITNPLFQYVWAHPCNKRIDVDLGYDRVRELFHGSYPEAFDKEITGRAGCS